jgi:hypothetical protein
MRVRDAVEADAGRMAAIADTPADVMRNLVHDRTVRVAEAESGDADPNVDVGDDADPPALGDRGDRELLGFVSFDVRGGRVHVTQVDGTRDAVERLLAEPVQFARGEGMEVELLVPDREADAGIRAAADAVGFRETGRGPRFEGSPTTRYRLNP